MEFTPGFYIWARRLVQLAFPSSCLTCPADVTFADGPVCSVCLNSVERRVQHRATVFLEDCLSAGPFTDILKKLIHLFKYSGKDYLAKVLAEVVIKEWPQPPFEVDALMAVPMPYWRELSRGYNQSFLLAQELGKHWRLPVITGSVRRRWNRSQTNLTREGRLKNAAKGFAPARKKHRGVERVLLIDDVLTTGATLDACARILKLSGVSKVSALTLAYD